MSIDKYYPKAKKVDDYNTYILYRSFIFSEKKLWTFDILNRVIFNRSNASSDFEEPLRKAYWYVNNEKYGMFKLNKTNCISFVDKEENKKYNLYCDRYLNKNTRVTITIKDLNND